VVPESELIALLHDPFVQLADVRLKPFDAHRQHLTCRKDNSTP
jgi:hypothetical protein